MRTEEEGRETLVATTLCAALLKHRWAIAPELHGRSVSASKTQDEGFRGSTTCRRAITLICYVSRRRVKLGFRDSVVAVLSSGWFRSAPAGFPGEDGADLCCTLQVDAQSSAGPPEIRQIRTSQTHHSGRSASRPWKKLASGCR